MSNLRFNSWFVKMDNNLVVFELPKAARALEWTIPWFLNINSLDLARVRDNTKYFYSHLRKFLSVLIFAHVIADGLVVCESNIEGLALFDEAEELFSRDLPNALLKCILLFLGAEPRGPTIDN